MYSKLTTALFTASLVVLAGCVAVPTGTYTSGEKTTTTTTTTTPATATAPATQTTTTVVRERTAPPPAPVYVPVPAYSAYPVYPVYPVVPYYYGPSWGVCINCGRGGYRGHWRYMDDPALDKEENQKPGFYSTESSVFY